MKPMCIWQVMEEKNPDLENKAQVAQDVGVGAIVFHYLLNSRIKDVNFIMDDALSFDGSTGPYAQYTYARTCSLIEKAGDVKACEVKITEPSEAALMKTLSRFEESVDAALRDYEPSNITRYIIDICFAFNRFYQDCKILGAESEDVRASRVALVKATNVVLGNALPLICMKTPRKI